MAKEAPREMVIEPTEPKHTLHLFKQPGYVLNSEHVMKIGQYTWTIRPIKCEMKEETVVDLEVTVEGQDPGIYLLTEISFQQHGNQKQLFENLFDVYRNTFYFRRALTIPFKIGEDGKTRINHYSHHRFLRCRDDDEPKDYDEALNWESRIPIQWVHDGEYPLPFNNNVHFKSDINLLEEFENTFVYYFAVEKAHKCNYMPVRNLVSWPKASRSARYIQRLISVDGKWFSRWPRFKIFMENVDLLAVEDFEDFIDVLGTYYHRWNFDYRRKQDLVRTAEKFGFYDFTEMLLILGDVGGYFSSLRSCLFVQPSHPLLKNNHNPPDQYNSKFIHGENFSFTVRCSLCQLFGPFLKSFKTQNNFSWTVNLHRVFYSGKEYLSVSLMLNGPFVEGQNQLWKVEFGPTKHSSVVKLPKRTHQRVLNVVQRTICFPTCWLWSDVIREMSANGPYHFTLKTQMSSLTGWKWDAVAGNESTSGMKTGQLMCGKTIFHVNMDLIQDLCGNLRVWVGMPGKPNRMELDSEINSNDFLHFLDQLYHSSKLYPIEQWKNILKVAEKLDCDRVVDQLERAYIRTEAQKSSDKSFSENYSLDYLRFNVEMRDQFHIQPIDEFLKNRPAVESCDYLLEEFC